MFTVHCSPGLRHHLSPQHRQPESRAELLDTGRHRPNIGFKLTDQPAERLRNSLRAGVRVEVRSDAGEGSGLVLAETCVSSTQKPPHDSHYRRR